MDVLAAAKTQGPVARMNGLFMVAIVFLGAVAFAAVRIVRDGGVDGWSVTWIVFAVMWAVGVVSLELTAHHGLARAARADMGSADARIVLFRVGQALRAGATTQEPAVNKGWISVGEHGLAIIASRPRATVGRYSRQDVVAAETIVATKAYGVLVLTFADGSRFESIPVETGIRNTGVSPERVSRIASDILAWSNSPTRA